jgi:ABC-type transport system involved in cytochrome bd biosynthesis fused ATPase/permease subunit
VPIDLVLVAVVVAVVVGLLGWFLFRTGGWFWLLVAVAVGGTAAVVMRPVFRRRRADLEERQRLVGHDSSWTSGKEEE